MEAVGQSCGMLVGVSEEEPGVHVSVWAQGAGHGAGALLGCRNILVLSGEGASSPLFWVMLPEPKGERSGSATGPSASSITVPSPDAGTTSQLSN